MAFLLRRGSVWYVEYLDPSGRRKRVSTKTSRKKIAQDVLARYQVDEASEYNDLPVRRKKTSLRELRDRYVEFAKAEKSPRWAKNVELMLDNLLLPFFNENSSIKEITVGRIEEYRRDRLKEVKPRTVNIETHHVLLTMLRKAIDWELMPESALPKVKKLPEQEGRLRFLTEDEAKALRKASRAASADLEGFVMIALNTGMRAGEILALRWKDINFNLRQIVVAPREGWSTKTKKGRKIPINDRLLDYLKTLAPENAGSEPVFSISYDVLKKSFKKLVKAAELPSTGEDKVTAHTLRHTFASHLVMKGTPLHTVARLLGHSSTTTTEIYSHLSPDHLQTAVNQLDI